MSFHAFSLILAGILSLADYVTEHIFSEKLRKNQKLISFAAGVAISYIILSLFPEIASSALIDGKKLFFYALFGFVSLNLIEQYLYKGIGKPKKLSVYHKDIHITYFFVYNIFVGILLVNFASKGIYQALLFFIPFLLYIIVEILPQEFKFKSKVFGIAYSMAPLLGVIITINNIDFVYYIIGELLAFVTGTLLYIVIRESLPSDEAEKPLYFIAGVLFYALIIFMSWNFI